MGPNLGETIQPPQRSWARLTFIIPAVLFLAVVAAVADFKIMARRADDQNQNGAHWREVGNVQRSTFFIEIERGYEQDETVYRDAINHFPQHELLFFLPGDRIPPSYSTYAEFYRAGGYSNYPGVAGWVGGEFRKSDCKRAGEMNAPLAALCDLLHAQHKAVMAVAARDGWVTGCHMKKFNGRAVVEAFVAQFDSTKRSFFLKAYDDVFMMYTQGPDDPAYCVKHRKQLEDEANEGKQLLVAATQHAAAQSLVSWADHSALSVHAARTDALTRVP